jgi:hypothetical protein
VVTVLGGAAVLAGAAALFGLVAAIERGHLTRWMLLSLAVVCGLVLLAMLLSDWPSAVLSEFWADHSVLSAVLSTLLLVGVGFLAFEAHDARIQSELDESVTAAGMGGIVQHLVDIEVALALASSAAAPDNQRWPRWSSPERPLRWLREGRDSLSRTATDGPSDDDPRGWMPYPGISPDADHAWRIELIDQGVRRTIGALRDWAPVLGRSRNGMSVLVDLGKLRNRLLEMQQNLRDGKTTGAIENLTCLRQFCRIMALALEHGSGSTSERDEVLLTFEPYSAYTLRTEWWARRRGTLERGTWNRQFADAWKQLTAQQSSGARRTIDTSKA